MVLTSVSKLLLLILRPANLPGDASHQWCSQGRPALLGRNTNSSTSPSRLLPTSSRSCLRCSPHPGLEASGLGSRGSCEAPSQVRAMRTERMGQLGRTPLPSSAPPAPCTAQGAPPIHNPLLPSGLLLWCSERLHLSQSNTSLHSSEEHCSCSGT